MENKKKIIRSTKEQIGYLIKYMHDHPAFGAGEYKGPLGESRLNREWAQVKEVLDELGPNRSVEQWKLCWRDQKAKARKEAGAIHRIKNKTGNTEDIPEISDESILVLNTIGTQMAVGSGPEESPIGWSPADVSLPVLAPTPVVPPPPPAGAIHWSSVALPPQPTGCGISGQQPAWMTVAAPRHPAPTAVAASRQPAPTAVAAPRQPAPRAVAAPRQRRVRKTHPPDEFIKAQLELNSLLKELTEEMKKSNRINEERNDILTRLLGGPTSPIIGDMDDIEIVYNDEDPAQC